MPWEHCGTEVLDDSRCPTCGIRKDTWTVKLKQTRQLVISNPWEGDLSQAIALTAAAAIGAPFCERCQGLREKVFVDLQAIALDVQPRPPVRVEVRALALECPPWLDPVRVQVAAIALDAPASPDPPTVVVQAVRLECPDPAASPPARDEDEDEDEDEGDET